MVCMRFFDLQRCGKKKNIIEKAEEKIITLIKVKTTNTNYNCTFLIITLNTAVLYNFLLLPFRHFPFPLHSSGQFTAFIFCAIDTPSSVSFFKVSL